MWRASSFSTGLPADQITDENADDYGQVEVQAPYSGGSWDRCARVRTSNDTDHTVLVERREWEEFVAGVKAGEFDNLWEGNGLG